ncbi:hypothetical protein [Gallaecimonas pentaromativorans]|uniref:Uncharacterized protein n=1 Tax=Gallaecimonas pentaromativorans TaxID=584787 RepID=A0A3N1NH61_9GAMM|nr:hypothetical protein [Gallaecimonas pentaromativorans]MED5526149.1 hypothetical protein [Pseudomonadota bacterium]ROQ19164.1 hypothetical protein EDC28_11284 [Gallaecimonas pentaromativorans]
MNLQEKLAQRLNVSADKQNEIVELREEHLEMISGAAAHGSAHGSGHASGHLSVGKEIAE